MRLGFYGAAGEVTGSCYLVETAHARVLVDFGLHQGGMGAEKKNRRLPPIDFERLDTVVLTHAHLDHAGRLPMLERAGYRGADGSGRIWATPATIGLCDILLKDAAAVMEMDAQHAMAGRERLRRRPVAPLYTVEEVERTLPRLAAIRYGEPCEIAEGITIRMVDAGHILGSASIEMTLVERGRTLRIAFSGDIGERGSPLLHDPTPIPGADVVVLESTYGDRNHRSMGSTLDELVTVLGGARAENGKVLIPAFAVGRTQSLVYHLGELVRAGRVRDPEVYVDSPMAMAATDLYRMHRDLWDDEAWALLNNGAFPLAFPGLRFTRSSAESRTLNTHPGSPVIIAASEMCTGGRILHHLKHSLWKPETRLLFVGFQGEGTLGRRLVDGATRVSVLGESIAVRAQVHTLGGFSAHAGQAGLLAWARASLQPRSRVFLTHGEDRPRTTLRDRLAAEQKVAAAMPAWGETVEL